MRYRQSDHVDQDEISAVLASADLTPSSFTPLLSLSTLLLHSSFALLHSPPSLHSSFTPVVLFLKMSTQTFGPLGEHRHLQEAGTRKPIDSQTIAPLARLLKEHFQHKYILGGGAALALEGSTRKTSDIDIPVPAEVANIIASSASKDCLVVKDGGLYLATDSTHIPTDHPSYIPLHTPFGLV